MQFFDRVVDTHFKKDASGLYAYYPWGVLSKGYLFDSEEKKVELHNHAKKMIMCSLLVALALFVLGKATGYYSTLPWFCGSGLALLILFIFQSTLTRDVTKGLERTKSELSFADSIETHATLYNLPILIALEVVSLAFVAGSFWMIQSGELLIAYSGIVFFGFAAILFAMMLNRKLK